MDLTIRTILPEERLRALSLVWRVFREYEAPDYTPEGVEELSEEKGKMRNFAILTAALLLLLTGCGWGERQVFNDIQGEPYANSSRYSAGNFTYAAADIDAVEINWRAGSVELVEGSGASLRVSESGGDLDMDTQMYHWLDGRTLRIQFCRSGAKVHVKSEDKALTVELPKGVDLSVNSTAANIHAGTLEQGKVGISSFSGKLDCGTLTADSIDISSSSGRITADRVEADTLRLSTASGAVDVGDIEVTGTLTCVSVSGSLTFGALKAAAIAIETTSANVDAGKLDCPSTDINSASGSLRLAMPEGGARVTFSSRSGSVFTDYPYERAGGLFVFGDGESQIHAVTTSGSLRIG